MKVKELIEELQKIENQDAIVVMVDGKYNDMQIGRIEYVNEWCDDCQKHHQIVYAKV